MCGIAGIISRNGANNLLQSWIADMSKRLSHRGTDDEGYLLINDYSENSAGGKDTPQQVWNTQTRHRPEHTISHDFITPHSAFVHRRLSIIDLSAQAHQPFCSHDGAYWILFNGEIYNYIELREELKRDKFIFVSNSDTEVLLNAYIRWGEDCVQHFNGMWSFCIFDKYKNKLFCSRDRFGVKPFYYYQNNDFFAFASEVKALVQLPFYRKEINESALFDLIALNQIEHDEECLFKQIYELQPAHNLIYDYNNREIQIKKYYSLQYNNELSSFDKKEYKQQANKLYELLEEAIRLRLRSDVPVGTCFSGGIDSSAIVNTIGKLQKDNEQYLFTAVFPNLAIDESEFCRAIVSQNASKWIRTEPNENEFIQRFDELNYANDFPIVSASTFAQFKVLETARQHNIKVLLDGQGADEMLAGYDMYYTSYINQLLKNGQYRLAKHELNAITEGYSATQYLQHKAKYTWLSSFPFLYRNAGINGLIQRDFWKQHQRNITKYNQQISDNLNQHLHFNFTKGALKSLLKYEDRCSMWHSVEARTPYADDIHLIEFVFTIPCHFKIHNGYRKAIFREAIKHIVPEQIAFRKDKKGFLAPTNQWMKNKVDTLIANIHPATYTFFDKKEIDKNLRKQILQLSETDNYTYLKIFSISSWLKQFFE